MTQYTESQLADLTDEERAALLEDEGGEPAASDAEDEGENLDGEDGASEEDEGDEGEGDEDEAYADDDLDAALLEEDGTADDDGAADAGDAGSVDDDNLTTETGAVAGDSVPSWHVPAGLKDKIAAVDTKINELAEQFDDGMLTATELRMQQKALQDEQEELKNQQRYADFKFRTELETYSKKTVPDFIEDHPVYKNPTFEKMLDEEVKRIQAASHNPFNPNILALAHKRISKTIADGFNIDPATLSPKPNAKAGKQNVAKKRPELPPTLHNVPAADISSDNGRWSHLKRLEATDYLAYEDALDKMPAKEREMYLAMG